MLVKISSYRILHIPVGFCNQNSFIFLTNHILLSIAAPKNSQGNSFDLEKSIDGLNTLSHQNIFCDHLLACLKFEENKTMELDSDSLSSPAFQELYFKKLALLTLFARTFLTFEDRLAPESLFKVVSRLHDVLLQVSNSPFLQEAISELCETWYLQDRSGKESIAPQMITYLLNRSLQTDSKVLDIRRLMDCAEALELIDWQDESSQGLKIMIQRTWIHTLFLTTNEGNKFLVWTFCKLPLVSAIHNTVKASLPKSNKWKQLAYAEIYYKSWKSAEGICKIRIEELALQNFVEASLYCKNISVIRAVRSILNYFVEQKANNRTVEELIFRICSPLVFPAIQVANPHVRENAIHQLGIIFPVIPPENNQWDFDASLQEQFNFLVNALEDRHTNVRNQAVLSVGRILSLYWEILQPHATHAIIGHLVTQVAFDQTSPLVRESVIKAMQAVLHNPLTQHTIRQKKYLTKLAPLIFDKNEKVRLSLIGLLETVKKIKHFPFYEVVQLEHIIAMLATETSPKAIQSATNVLLPSYWPYPKHEVNEMVKRAFSLIKDNPRAAVAFYSNANLCQSTKYPVNIVVQFIIQLWLQGVRPFIESQGEISTPSKPKSNAKNTTTLHQSTSKDKNAYNSDEIDYEDEGGPVKKSKTGEEVERPTKTHIHTILEIVARVWENIEPMLGNPSNSSLIRELLTTVTDNDLVTIHERWPHPSLSRIACRLPLESLSVFSNGIIDRICNPPSSTYGKSKRNSYLISCIFSWSHDLAVTLINRLKQMLQHDLSKTPSINSIQSMNQAVYILKSIITEDSWVRHEFVQMEQLKTDLEPALAKLNSRLMELCKDDITNVDILKYLPAAELYYKWMIHIPALTQKPVEESKFKDLVIQLKSVIISSLATLSRPDEVECEVDKQTLDELKPGVKAMISLLIVLNDVSSMGMIRKETEEEIFSLVNASLRIRCGFGDLKTIVFIAWKLISRVLKNNTTSNEWQEQISQLVLLALMRDTSPQKRISSNNLRLLLLNSSTKSIPLLETLLNFVCQSIAAQLPEGNLEFQLDETEELPLEISTILAVISVNAAIHAQVAKYLQAHAIQSRESSLAQIWTVIQLIRLIMLHPKSHHNLNSNPLKRILIELKDSFSEADENESVLIGRVDQICKILLYETKPSKKR